MNAIARQTSPVVRTTQPARQEKPVVTIVHSLPGRVRAKLSHPPRDAARLRAAVMEHEGLRSVDYSPVTRSILVRFDPRTVSQQEIVLRIAVHLSMDYGAVPVRLLAEPQRVALSDSAVYAAVGLASAQLARWLRIDREKTRWIDRIAGLGTAAAVVDHAWKETQQRGYFDPEVFSLAYLLTAFSRGRVLGASAVTWLTAFGRHLLEPSRTGVEVRPLEIPGAGGDRPRYELLVGPDVDAPEQVRALGALQGLLKFALTGGAGYRNLWEELRDVSKVHGEVLEGFGRMRHGIPVRFG
jgi:hypothetical protein